MVDGEREREREREREILDAISCPRKLENYDKNTAGITRCPLWSLKLDILITVFRPYC